MIEYLLSNMWAVWSVIAVLGLIIELSSGDFFVICFSIGAVGAAIAAPFSNIYIQLGVFVVVTALSIFQVRPFALKYLHKNDDNRVSNADALIGQTGRVSQTIPVGEYGRVAIGGDDWKAKSDSNEPLSVGTAVKVVDCQSIIITVEKI
jgi:membrane protein implicated in regulation of membrane protease activity